MKASKKITLLVAAILVAVGAVVGFVGIYMMNFNFTNFDTRGKIVTNTYEIKEEFSNITFKGIYSDVRLVYSDDGICRVVCNEREQRAYDVKAEDGTLTVSLKNEGGWKWYHYIGMDLKETSVTVYLPKTEYGALTLTGSVGDVLVPRELSFENADISTDTGDVVFYASVKDLLKVKTSTGEIEIDGISAKLLDVLSDTGDISISSVNSETITVNVDTADVEINSVECKNISGNSSTGEMQLKNVIASETLSIETSTGEVEMVGCDGALIRIKTSTGDVYGELMSEKVFVTQTSTGDVKVPISSGEQRCEISTSTGDIEIIIK